MNVCLIAFGLTLGCGVTGPGAHPAVHGATVSGAAVPDRWVGEDKLRHFAASFAATEMGYGATRLLTEPDAALPVAATAAVALGLAKEVHDGRHGRFSLKDLAWDAAGVALGVVLARRIE